jgi:hypothetical protein
MRKLFFLFTFCAGVLAVQAQTFTSGLTTTGTGATANTRLGGTSAFLANTNLELGTFNFNLNNGKVGIGIAAPLSLLHIKAGTATVAPLIFTTGINLTTPIAGAVEYNGTSLLFTPTTALGRKTIAYADLTNLSGVLPITNGGTSFSTYATGDIIYASAANVLSKRTIGATNQVLTVIGGVPTWAAPSLTGITGTLPIANGGTGATTAIAALAALLPAQSAATNGMVLRSNGLATNATSWVAATGTGTVTAIGINALNGVSGTSSGGATPNLTISLGAITPTSVAATGTVAGSNLSGTNTGDNAINTTYANDYRLANFVAGTNYLAPNGSGASLTGITAAQAGAQTLNTNLTSIGALANGAGVLTNNGAGVFSYVAAGAATNYWTATGVNIANNTTGNVGIGTGATAPATKLDVNGAITTNGGLLMKSGALIQMWNSTNGNYGQISSFDGGGFKMSTGVLKEVNILNNGNVGIGVAAPTSLLHLPLSGNIAIGTPDVNNTEGAALSSNELRFRTNANYYTSLATVPGAYELQVLDKNNSTLGGIKANIAKVNSIYSTNNFIVANVLDGQLKVGGQVYGGIPFYVKENSGTTDVYPSMIIEGGKSTAAATNVPLSLHLKPSINIDNVTTGISFGGNNIGGVDNSNSSQAGIYVRSSNVQGTSMKFATTNAYANGAQMRMTINPTGNVGIGTENPQALLDVQSTTNGVAFPRMTTAQKTAIVSPIEGLEVYDINLKQKSFYNGTTWVQSLSAGAGAKAWLLGGNAGIGAGDGFGTTDNTALVFKLNNLYYGRLDPVINSNFLGYDAGYYSSSVNNSNFLGATAGSYASYSNNSNFLGELAGYYAASANNSNFIGTYTGWGAVSANNSNFLGRSAGYGASYSNNSNFLGSLAGYSASGVSYSNFFGTNVGKSFTGNNVGSNNIIIGTNISLPNAASNSMNIGGVLFGTGFYSDVNATDPSILPTSTGKIGIGTSTPTEKLDVNGNIYTNGKILIGQLNTAVVAPYALAVNGPAIFTKATVKLNANWPDYVFEPTNKLPTLAEVEAYIAKHKHLQDVPSAAEVKEKGIDLGDNQIILLKKVEELTLYIIDQDKKIVKLQAEKDELKNMQKQIDELKAMLLKK